MSEIKSEYKSLNEQNEYDTHFFKTSADLVVGLGRMKSTAYTVGDVAYSDTNYKIALKCITAGTTSSNELDVSGKAIGDTVTDGSVTWQVCNRTSDVTSVNGKTGDVVVDLPVGHMYWSVEPNVPVGRLPALGATYNRALYADLWAWANSVGLVKPESEWQAIASANGGNCAYYSSGDGSTTFRAPKLPNTLVTDASNGTIPVYGNGTIIGITTNPNGFNAGLRWLNSSERVSAVSGAYGGVVGNVYQGTVQDNEAGIGLTTDATKSGIVAKTSSSKITGQWLITAFGVAHNIGEADVANVMQAVEQVQTSVGTLEQGVGTAIDYIVESYRNGTEWYEVYKSGKVRQGGFLNPGGTGTLTFLKPFANTNYGIWFQEDDLGKSHVIGLVFSAKNTGSLSYKQHSASTFSNVDYADGIVWVAEGQGA